MNIANRASLTLLSLVAATLTARSAVVVQYSFEGNLNDSAAGGIVADNLTYNQGVSGSATAVFSNGNGTVATSLANVTPAFLAAFSAFFRAVFSDSASDSE